MHHRARSAADLYAVGETSLDEQYLATFNDDDDDDDDDEGPYHGDSHHATPKFSSSCATFEVACRVMSTFCRARCCVWFIVAGG